MSKIKSYPTKVWVLTPAFKPKEVELRSRYSNWNGQDYHSVLGTSKIYNDSEIAFTKAEIIKVGRERLKKQQDDLAKKQAALTKRTAALDKAEPV